MKTICLIPAHVLRQPHIGSAATLSFELVDFFGDCLQFVIDNNHDTSEQNVPPLREMASAGDSR
jgi:hypothetical protein